MPRTAAATAAPARASSRCRGAPSRVPFGLRSVARPSARQPTHRPQPSTFKKFIHAPSSDWTRSVEIDLDLAPRRAHRAGRYARATRGSPRPRHAARDARHSPLPSPGRHVRRLPPAAGPAACGRRAVRRRVTGRERPAVAHARRADEARDGAAGKLAAGLRLDPAEGRHRRARRQRDAAPPQRRRALERPVLL